MSSKMNKQIVLTTFTAVYFITTVANCYAE
jgi:hypothetical protein